MILPKAILNGYEVRRYRSEFRLHPDASPSMSVREVPKATKNAQTISLPRPQPEQLMEVDPLAQPANHSRPDFDFHDRPRPHGEELPYREALDVPTDDIEDHHAADEDFKGKLLVQARVTLRASS